MALFGFTTPVVVVICSQPDWATCLFIMAENNEPNLSIEAMWEEYFQITGFDKSKISEGQYDEMRRTFISAIGMHLVQLRDVISMLPEDVGIMVLEEQAFEVGRLLGIKQQPPAGKVILLNEPGKILH